MALINIIWFSPYVMFIRIVLKIVDWIEKAFWEVLFCETFCGEVAAGCRREVYKISFNRWTRCCVYFSITFYRLTIYKLVL